MFQRFKHSSLETSKINGCRFSINLKQNARQRFIRFFQYTAQSSLERQRKVDTAFIKRKQEQSLTYRSKETLPKQVRLHLRLHEHHEIPCLLGAHDNKTTLCRSLSVPNIIFSRFAKFRDQYHVF